MTVVAPWRTRCARTLNALACGAAGLLAACHSTTNYPPGTPVITMSDLTNSGDFISYIVNIDSIQLTRSDGTIATPLLTPVTLDLAELNNTSLLLEAPAVPDGTYNSATVTLDYTLTPSVTLNNQGTSLAAVPVNILGQSMTAVGVTVTFDPSHPLVVPLNQGVRLHVDVDLTASNELIVGSSPTQVQVQPFVVVTPAPVDSTVLRLRGLFVTTQDVPSGFYMNALPTLNGLSPLGAVIVNTNAQTYFSVNGIVYIGAPGLTALAGQQQNVPMAVYGTLDSLSGITPTFNATQVYFGTSESSELAYYFTGTVAARSSDTVTLRGATYVIPPNYITTLGLGYLDSLPVTLGSGTAVYQDGVATPGLTIGDVSVGQQITVAGQATLDSSLTPVSLNATSGLLRLRPTTLWGNQVTAGTLDLSLLGPFAPAEFSFAGTGTSGNDANPSSYVVDTSAVPAGPVTTTGELLQVQGGVAPFGTAPPDFKAQTLTPGPSTLQTLVVNWVNGGSTKPFTSVSSSGLVVNLADADLGPIHEIRTGPASLELKSLPASPLITTTGAPQSDLRLAIGSTSLTTGISVFNSATAFANAVSSDFNGTNKISRLVAYGQYDIGSNTFVASRISVALHE